MIRLAVAAATAFAAVWFADDVEALWSRPEVAHGRTRVAAWLTTPGEPQGSAVESSRALYASPTPLGDGSPSSGPDAIEAIGDPRSVAPEPADNGAGAQLRRRAETALVEAAAPTARPPALVAPEAPTAGELTPDFAEVDVDVPPELSPDEARRIRCRLDRVMSVARGSGR